ncbi:hypothetical protein MIR68_009979 [Amoeboaphelidium protococcarum]|nr:hypothetical protein MIR68_009979 [Amoeboaphelidium protococcarum]
MRLADARASVTHYESFIKLAMKEQEPEAMNFEDADEEQTQSVAGVDASRRRWTSFVIDENIQPASWIPRCV